MICSALKIQDRRQRCEIIALSRAAVGARRPFRILPPSPCQLPLTANPPAQPGLVPKESFHSDFSLSLSLSAHPIGASRCIGLSSS